MKFNLLIFVVSFALLSEITSCNTNSKESSRDSSQTNSQVNTPASSQDSSKSLITEQQALEIAKKYLRKKGELGKKFIENSAKAEDRGNKWFVIFQRKKKDVIPDIGIIIVDKSTGKAKWFPLR